ncbi:unnamed protein product [Fusarium graminearum]|uniref:Chromosome 4, complete genome n=1 Tax=Gibberella zeae (strain ATCC MYA-4620 / CBS 123657 / FGSC 9075 / NRRL 31084 / PH-1) TaxID=229533 RepID=A0A098DTC5_GIBZE|nr:unnamed protein product [Fusarium graminearum]
MSTINGSPSVTRGAFFAAGVVAVFVTVYPLAAKVQRRNETSRPDGITIVHDPPSPKFEIVAVHGLGAHPVHTWEGKPSTGSLSKLHLLRDLLREDFPTARISSFAYNSDWLVDAPEKTAQQIGRRLLEKLSQHRGDSQRLPIIFIGHSFGGIVIKEALCAADTSSNILEDTCGIIFLGTPHQGSSLSTPAALLSQLTGFLGSNKTLLLNLRRNHSQLSDLEDRFRPLVQFKPVISFYETKPAYLLGLSIGCIVDRESARGSSIEPVGIDTDHAGLNKFDSPKHPGYRALKDAVKKLRVKSLLEQADDHIREKHYTSERLKIERLSGDPLLMDQCYINLSIVDHIKTNAKARNQSEDSNSTSQLSPFSLFARQKVEMPIAEIQVRLADVFNERKEPDGNILLPRRVLVRGRAGVGKTTLCKKMVHDFIRNKMWHETFDRVLWVPLRNLKQRAGLGYDLRTLFDHEFFRFSGEHKKSDGTRFARELYKTLTLGRTLFILDGWDEVAGTSKDDDMFAFLYELLSQPNVIITSRPSATLPHGIDVDLELETIGFSPAQVDEYIEKTHGENVDELKAFLRSHQLVRGLVRIPVQLDAFCYCWGDIGSDREKKPETMTTLYQAIQTSLCKKDAARLEKIKAESLTTASQSFIEKYVKDELRFLEHLAFAGLAADKIEFNLSDRNRVNEDSSLLLDLDKSLPCLSFLRTSDPSAKSAHQLYHFIHLTFQEYFAARYFVRHWTEKREKREMQYTLFEKKSTRVVHPIDFLQKHKYDAGYDIMWRFVAGLLDDADEYQSARFFEEIEKEPADLLGPTHQRLVMHCLSEATSLPDEIRGSRERRLAEWVLFEIDYTGSSTLVRESELPDRVLCDVLSISGKKKVVLGALGSSERVFSHSITTALTQLLKDKDSDVRYYAARAIGKQSILSDTTVAALVELFKDKDSDARYHAAEAIGKQSTLSDTTVAALMELFKDKDRSIRSSAARAIGKQSILSDTTVAALMELFKDKDRSVRSSAAEAIGKQSILSDTTVAALIELIKDKDSIARSYAAEAIGKQSILSDMTVAALMELFKDKDSSIRSSAARAIGNQSTLSDTTVAALVELLKDEDRSVRYHAARAIGKQSTLSDTTVAALMELFKDKDRSVRSSAAEAIGNQSILSDTTVAALMELFKDKDSSIRSSAARAIGNQSILSDTIVAALVELFKDKDSDIRYYAARAIGKQSILSDTTVAALVELFKDKDSDARYHAAEAIGNQSILSDTIVAALVELIKDKDSDARYHAAEAIGNQSILSDTTVATLVELIKDEDSDIRSSAARAIGKQSILLDTTVAALIKLLKHEDRSVRYHAAEAVGNEPTLIGRIAEVLGLSAQSQSQTPGATQTLRHIQHIEPLYKSFLRQGFKQQFSLYNSDSLLIINQSSGLRMALLDKNKDAFRVSVRNGQRELREAYDYLIWESLEGMSSQEQVSRFVGRL